jgi:hypothetical protein
MLDNSLHATSNSTPHSPTALIDSDHKATSKIRKKVAKGAVIMEF